MDERTKIDVNQEHTIAGITYDSNEDIINLNVNPINKRLRVDASISGNDNDIFDGYGLYAVLDDGTNLYICYQNKDDKWIITRINDTTGIVTYAKGSSDTATNWTNRATLDYNDYAHTS